MATGNADRYWTQFVQSSSSWSERPRTYYEAFRFGSGATLGAPQAEVSRVATVVGALVVAGTKTSTASLLWFYEAEGKRPPKVGDLCIVLDGHDRPVCIIETTEVKIVPFDEMVDEQFAYEGGEGDRTLESWRRMYGKVISAQCGRIKREPTQNVPLVCERFRVIYKACEPPQEILDGVARNRREEGLGVEVRSVLVPLRFSHQERGQLWEQRVHAECGRAGRLQE